MLEIRPSCENCDRKLPPESTDAMICSFECTFCRECVDAVLGNVCPNCGGGFTARPIRPARDRKGGYYTGAFPPSPTVKHRPVDPAAHERFSAGIRSIPPQQR
jgi:hypothetical protein